MSIDTFIMKNTDLPELTIEELFPACIDVNNHFGGSWQLVRNVSQTPP